MRTVFFGERNQFGQEMDHLRTLALSPEEPTWLIMDDGKEVCAMQFSDNLWFKSSRTVEHNQCVEVALTSKAVGVRDTKDRHGGQLTVGADQWQRFLGELKNGAYDQ